MGIELFDGCKTRVDIIMRMAKLSAEDKYDKGDISKWASEAMDVISGKVPKEQSFIERAVPFNIVEDIEHETCVPSFVTVSANWATNKTITMLDDSHFTI